MKKSIISFFIGLMGFGFLASSCEDMLTPDLERYTTQFSGTDTVNFYMGIMRNLQQVTEQNILLGELRGDLITTTDFTTDSIDKIANFQNPENGDCQLLNRAAYYKVINQCNFYLDRVDTISTNNNHHFMYRETAQVLLVRAWTYMQLVQNYGRVPFITKPVVTSTTGWEKNPEAWATPENLVDLLKDDLERAQYYCKVEGYPNYSNVASLNTGSKTIDHRLMNFDADVVTADLYLLRGASTADFEKAAEHYFNFLYKEPRVNTTAGGQVAAIEQTSPTSKDYYIESSRWKGDPNNDGSYTFGSHEIVTGVPSAANSHFGLVLTRIPNICGFDIHSTNYTSTSEDSEGNENSSTSGSVSITSNYKVRQIAPSASYIALNRAQSAVVYDKDEGAPIYFDAQDGRLNASAPLMDVTGLDENTMRFITKFGNGNVDGRSGKVRYCYFRFMLPLYRYRTIMMHYAEALNRAGFPHHAFAVLSSGLDAQSYPEYLGIVNTDTIVETKTLHAKHVFARSNIYNPEVSEFSEDELVRAMSKPWIKGITEYSTSRSQAGIHAAGCGNNYVAKKEGNNTTVYKDSIYNYAYQVAKRLNEEDQRLGKAAARRTVKMYEGEGEDGEGEGGEGEGGDDPIDVSDFEVVIPEPAAVDPDEMRAVELILADEYALETAFEGQRYFDLMRIARHLNHAEGGNYGTEWMAWKIARRNLGLKPYEEPTQKDATIYNYLLDEQNWYLQNPKY